MLSTKQNPKCKNTKSIQSFKVILRSTQAAISSEQSCIMLCHVGLQTKSNGVLKNLQTACDRSLSGTDAAKLFSSCLWGRGVSQPQRLEASMVTVDKTMSCKNIIIVIIV